MSVCSICRFQIVDNSTSICPNCGAPVESTHENDDIEAIAKDVTSDNADSYSPPDNTTEAGEDSIEICNPGDFLCDEQNDTEDPPEALTPDDINEATGPIGQSEPLPSELKEEAKSNSDDTGKSLTKLSDEQVKNIRSDLLSSNGDYASPNDAANLIGGSSTEDNKDKDDVSQQDKETSEEPEISKDFSNEATQTVPVRTSDVEPASPTTETAPPVRRIAFFHKNFIQLTGPFNPAAGEELVVGERHYLLKPKKIKNHYTIAAYAVMMVIILFLVGKQFITPTMPGQGTIIGMLLDEDNRPFINGIKITIPESGKKVVSDPLGFFRFESVPPGVYKLHYTLADGTTLVETISVADGEITMLTLGGEDLMDFVETPPPAKKSYKQIQASNKTQTQKTSGTSKPAIKAPTANESKKSSSKKQYSALKLKANVANAKLRVNGQVFGQGNLTYKKLAPGKHKAEVSKSGYKTWRGTIRLKENQTYSLKVNLEKIETAKKAKNTQPAEPTYTAEDFFQSGKSMLADGNVSAAIDDFSEAIKLKPSMADAYVSRAEAYQMSGSKNSAVNDLIRAGEIYTGKKRSETAYQLFTQALKINNKSVSALLNIGDYCRKKGDKDEALRQYKNVLRIDKNNYRANLEAGIIYYAMGKNRDADKRFKLAKKANPRNPQIYHYLMLNYLARDDFKKVKTTYAEFKDNTSESDVESFKTNMRYDAIHRIVGEYERP
ncbi:MAG: tetratricopeptide repeat protein [candidate division Zixibacteria bacterium]|nr:tetratricopeptide repeat protein [candidate division Zixibacteria bacterium]